MRPLRITVICYCLIFVASVIVLVEIAYFWSVLNDKVSFKTKNINANYEFVGNEFKNMQWMMQISDLHLSNFSDSTRISEFAEFCSITLDVIKPSVVLVTGDITDAVKPKLADSTQIENEWKAYKNILDANQVTSKTIWLDMRGNHDTFNVYNTNSSNNFFEKYSIQGRNHPRSYFYVSRMDNGENIGLIAVDTSLTIGLKILYNFAGELTNEEEHVIRSYVEKARSLNVKYLIWFGHYPTSSIRYPDSKKLRELISNEETSVAFLSGHMHQVGGMAPNMYSYMKEAFFELELADWKVNRIIRIMSIDHGQFSFVDVKHGEWPIILVTNPKTEVLVSPAKNFFISSPHSSHIRLLVFSPFPITGVKLKIDNEEWKFCSQVNGSFYVIAWDQNLYQSGLHTITVEAEDIHKNVRRINHAFSLDGSRSDRKFFARFFLMPNLGLFVQSLLIFFVVVCVAPLVVFRYLTTTYKMETEEIPTNKYDCVIQWFKKFYVICDINRFYFPLVLFPIYLLFGPWAIVSVLDNKIGVLFSWGILVDGRVEPPSWILNGLGIKQLFVHLYVIMHCAGEIDKRILNKRNYSFEFTLSCCLFITWDNFFFVLIMLVQIIQMILLWIFMGFSVLFIGPFTSWWLVMAIWMKKEIICMDEKKLLHLRRLWYPTLDSF